MDALDFINTAYVAMRKQRVHNKLSAKEAIAYINGVLQTLLVFNHITQFQMDFIGAEYISKLKNINFLKDEEMKNGKD